MARMIPPRFDESTTSTAERVLYYRLQDHLEDAWTVLHSLPWLDGSRPRLGEGECDFILLHPAHGLLVLEAKSGTPRYDGGRGEWRHEDGRTLTDPFVQARRGMHAVVDLLGRGSPAWREAPLPYGYAVAFPDARAVRGALRPDMTPDLILLEPDLDRLQARIVRLLARFARPPAAPDAGAVAAALAVLQPALRLVPALGSRIEAAGREQVRLTADQAETLAGLAGNRRLVVRGGAGTGKTLLAAAEARRRATAGQRVLVLCFNRPLGAFLREQLAAAGPAVRALTFHELCLEVLREAGAEAPATGDGDFWDELFQAALAALPGATTRHDAILVDEAQDFRDEWWLLIEEFLADPERSALHLFIDDRQNLYGRSGRLPFTEPEFRLRRNCRNTEPIARFARRAIGLEAGGGALPDGPEPAVHEVADARAERDAVRRVLHELVHEQGIAPDRIAVLGCHRLEKSSFAGRERLGNLVLREAAAPPAPNTVPYATVHRFKGLEADCVLLTGIGEPSAYYRQEHWRRFLYVGGSRARAVLHVFARPGSLPGEVAQGQR